MNSALNLRLFRKANGLKQDIVAEYLGVSKPFISQVENGKVSLPEDKIAKLIGNDKGWIIDVPHEKNEPTMSNEPHSVPLLPIFAQAGHLSGWSESVMDTDCEQVISPVHGVDIAVHIYGESMYPDIPNGSVVYVKKVSGRIIDYGKPYILDTVDGPLLKYVAPGHDDGFVKCISANHDAMYAPFEVSKTDIIGMYRVVMCMSMK